MKGRLSENCTFPVGSSYSRPLAHDSALGLTGIQHRPFNLAPQEDWAHVCREQWRTFEFFGVVSALQHLRLAHNSTSWALRNLHHCFCYFFSALCARRAIFWALCSICGPMSPESELTSTFCRVRFTPWTPPSRVTMPHTCPHFCCVSQPKGVETWDERRARLRGDGVVLIGWSSPS